MAQAERTTTTGGQVTPLDSDGIDGPIPAFPTDRELVTGVSGDGKDDTVGVEGPPERVSLGPLADSDGRRRWQGTAYETLPTGADGTCDHRAGPEHAAKPAPLAPGTSGIARQVQQHPAVGFDVNAVADDRGRSRWPERVEAIPEGS